MPAVVSNATRIWEIDIYWDLHAQCGVWDPKGKGVDIWECIRPRESYSVMRHLLQILNSLFTTADHSTPTTQPPNGTYWRYVTRR